MIKEDGQVIHFNNPKVQASLAANTFAVTGHAETKRMLNILFFCFAYDILSSSIVRLKKKVFITNFLFTVKSDLFDQ